MNALACFEPRALPLSFLLFTSWQMMACSPSQSALEAAEEQYKIASDDIFDEAAKCRAARNVKEVALRERDTEAYELWSIIAYNDCSKAN